MKVGTTSTLYERYAGVERLWGDLEREDADFVNILYLQCNISPSEREAGQAASI